MPEQVCVGKLRRRYLGNLVIAGPWSCAGFRAKPQAIPSGGFTNASMLGDYFLGTIDRASAQVIDASGGHRKRKSPGRTLECSARRLERGEGLVCAAPIHCVEMQGVRGAT